MSNSQAHPSREYFSKPNVKGSLRRNVIFGLLLVAIIPLILLGSITFFRSNNLIRDLTSSQMQLLVENNINQLEELYQTNQKMIQTIQTDDSVSKTFDLLLEDPQHQTRRFTAELFLASYQTKYGRTEQPLFDQLAFLDASGKYIIGTNAAWTEDNFTSKDDPILSYLGKPKTGLFLNPTSLYKNQLVLVSSWPLINQSNILLGTFFAFSTSDLFKNQLINTSAFFPNAEVYYITQNNQFVSFDKSTNQFIYLEKSTPTYEMLLEKVRERISANFQSASEDPSPFIGYLGTSNNIDTAFSLQLPQNYLVQQIDILGPFNLTILAISLLTLIGVGYFASSSIVNPIITLVDQARDFSMGNWDSRVEINRNDEIGLLATTFNEMGMRINSLYHSLEKRVEENTERFRLTSEITRAISDANQRTEMLQKTLNLLVKRFEFSYVCLFFQDSKREQMVLTYQSGSQPENQYPIGYRFSSSTNNEINWVSTYKQVRRFDHKNKFSNDQLVLFPQSHCQVIMPITLDEQTNAVLNIHASDGKLIDDELILVLQEIIEHIINGWQHLKSTEKSFFSLNQSSPLFQAGLKLAGCDDINDAFLIVLRALEQVNFTAGIFSIEDDQARLVAVAEPGNSKLDVGKNLILPISNIPLNFLGPQPTIINDLYSNKDAERTPVISLIRNRNCQSGVVLPIVIKDNLSALLIIGSKDDDAFTEQTLNSVDSMLSVLKVAISRIEASKLIAQQVEQLRIADEISRDIAGSLSIEEILKKSVNLVRDRFGFYHTSVFIVDSMGEFAAIQESTGPVGEQLKLSKHKLAIGSNSLVGKSTYHRQCVVSNDVTTDPSYFPNPFLPETRAELVMPLITGNQLLGALDVQSTRRNAFDPDSIRILQVLADQLSSVIINARLYHGSQMNLVINQALSQLTAKLTSEISLQEIFNLTVSEIFQIFPQHRISLYYLVSGLVMDLMATAGGSFFSMPANHIRRGEGFLGSAWESGKPELVKDTLAVSDISYFKDEVRSMLVIPLSYGREIRGLIVLEGKEPGTISEDIQEILETWSYNLSAIISNSQLVQQIRQQVDRQKKINQVSDSIRQSLDIQTILETTTIEICQTLGAWQAKIEIDPQYLNNDFLISNENPNPEEEHHK